MVPVKNNMRADDYRPRFHFTPPSQWMNDPNGLVYADGRYHLFYQHHPHSTEWGPMHWGHAVSRDLLQWQDRPIALAPHATLGVAFSGSAVVDLQNSSGLFARLPAGTSGLVAVYTNVRTADGHEINSGHDTQEQSIAYSCDNGESWEYYRDNPVITNPGLPDFRDPKVMWHEPSSRWILVLAAGTEVRFYSSANLREWAWCSSFGNAGGASGWGSRTAIWECPDLFWLPYIDDGVPQHDGRWVLVTSLSTDDNSEHDAPTQYFVGTFDGTTFTPQEQEPSEVRLVDYGADFYAMQSWYGVPKRRVWVGWMAHWHAIHETPTREWRGNFTIPRELTLRRANGRPALAQTPCDEMAALRARRAEPYTVRDTVRDTTRDGASAPDAEGRAGHTERTYLWPDLSALDGCCEILISLPLPIAGVSFLTAYFGTPGADTAHAGSVADAHEALRIRIAHEGIEIDRRRCCDGASEKFRASAPLRHRAQWCGSAVPHVRSVRLFIDTCTVELFAQAGLIAMSSLIFPRAPLSQVAFRTDAELPAQNATGADRRGITEAGVSLYKIRPVWNAKRELVVQDTGRG